MGVEVPGGVNSSASALKLKRRDLNSQLEYLLPLRVLKSGVTLKVRYA